MSRTLISGLLFALILQILTQISCVPLSGVERESNGRQLDFPNDNEIPVESIPRDSSVPRQIPGFPRRGPDGIVNRIVNFFKGMLGMPTSNDGDVGGVGSGREGGILGFIRRTFSGLINRFMSVLGIGSNQTPALNPDAAEFPYQRPRLEPLRRN